MSPIFCRPQCVDMWWPMKCNYIISYLNRTYLQRYMCWYYVSEHNTGQIQAIQLHGMPDYVLGCIVVTQEFAVTRCSYCYFAVK